MLAYAQAVPELPEVESVRRSLVPHLVGRTITGVDIRRRDIVSVVASDGKVTPLPARNSARMLMVRTRINALERRGKQIAVIASMDDPILIVHLGMTGQFFCLPPGGHLPEAVHVHLVWRLDSGARLIFRDPRRFGGVWSLANHAALEARWAELGPDALTIDARTLATRLARAKRPIKSALLDQAILAGVGNIYADESLFLARIAPQTIAATIPGPKITKLAASIRAVLVKAIAAGGSSLPDGMYIDADRRPGAYQLAHSVYGRSGKTCPVCQTPLQSTLISNRTTVWCPSCQGTV